MGCCGASKEEAIEELANGGIVKKRGFTDLWCVGVFGSFIFLWFLIGSVAFTHGDPKRLLLPTDSYHRVCGGEGMEDKPYALYFNPALCLLPPAPGIGGGECRDTKRICVSKCTDTFETMASVEMDTIINDLAYYNKMLNPNVVPAFLQDAVPQEPQFLFCMPQSVAKLQDLIDDPDNAGAVLADLASNEDCNVYTMKTTPMAGRCFPDMSDADTLQEATNNCVAQECASDGKWMSSCESDGGDNCAADCQTMCESDGLHNPEYKSEGGLKTLAADVGACWKVLLLMAFFAIFASFIWIVVLKYLGGVIVWTIVIGFNLVWFSLSFWAYKEKTFYSKPANQPYDPNMFEKPGFWSTILTISGIIFLVVFCITLFMIKRIRLATQMLSEATNAISKIKSTIFFPLVLALMHGIVFGWYSLGASYIATAGVPIYKKIENGEYGERCDINEYIDPQNPKFDQSVFQDENVKCVWQGDEADFGWIKGEWSIFVVQTIHLFGFYWLVNLVVAIGQFTLAGTFSQWYFTQRDNFKKLADNPLRLAFSFVWKNIGSLIFGSLIIAIIQTLRAILNYMDKKFKNSQNAVIKGVMMCLKCCLWCFEKCMKYINKNAYIVCGIYGWNFCKSACHVFGLIFSNAARFAAVGTITNILIKIGIYIIAFGNVVLAYIMFSPDNSAAMTDGGEKTFRSRMGVTEEIDNLSAVYFVIFVLSYAISKAFFLIYDMAVNTIFICFLEDEKMNDGSKNRPYFMSAKLRKIIE